jgi:hypothetical protein
VLFLQQLGRGLRTTAGKTHLDVVDFVGNHVAFLSPLRTLLSLTLGRKATNRDLAAALRDREALSLPVGCSVDYSLEAVDLLESLLRQRRSSAPDVLTDLCRQIAEEEGVRPSALQVMLAGGNVGAARQRAGGWFEFLDELGLLSPEEQRVLARHADFLTELAVTSMTRSFKMVLLRAMLHGGHVRSGLRLDELAAQSLRVVQGDPRLAADVATEEIPHIHVVETARWEAYWRKNPVEAWAGGRFFSLEEGWFAPTFSVAAEDGEVFDAMVAELVEWRLHRYFVRRDEASHDGEIELKVSHSSGSPILRFDRRRHPEVPLGDVELVADGERYTARFVKIAVNVMTQGGEAANALPNLMRRWFGPAAGLPGTDHRVLLHRGPAGWELRPRSVGLDGADELSSMPHFPTYAVACGAFGSPTPGDLAPRRQSVTGLNDLGPDDFLVTVRGDSMAGGPQPVGHGDLVRMRWARGQSAAALVGRPVLVELGGPGGGRAPALKVLARSGDGYVLRSTAEGYEDIPASSDMTVVAELVGRVDPSHWNPLARWVGQAFRRDAVPGLFDLDQRSTNWQVGHVSLPEDTILFVTLTKEAGRAGEDYVDRFESPEVFHWTSQASTTPEGKKGREIIEALDTGRRFHLFARRHRKDLVTYCGLLAPLRHEGSMPMTVWFRLLTPLDPQLQRQFLDNP